jgi:hypothetical protein
MWSGWTTEIDKLQMQHMHTAPRLCSQSVLFLALIVKENGFVFRKTVRSTSTGCILGQLIS